MIFTAWRHWVFKALTFRVGGSLASSVVYLSWVQRSGKIYPVEARLGHQELLFLDLHLAIDVLDVLVEDAL